MRIAVPVTEEDVAAPIGACEALRLYEDDHGKILRSTRAAVAGEGFEAVCAALERSGADVVVCGALTEDEHRALATAGLLLAPGAEGDADAAVRAYLSRAIACDPGNSCNYCGWKDECPSGQKT